MLFLCATLALALAQQGPQQAYERFLHDFRDGTDCPRLFQLRNDAKPHVTVAQEKDMNDKLRSVQCYSDTSKRVTFAANDGSFTVKEYRIYRTIINSPMSVREAQAVRDAAKKYSVTEADVRKTTDKVMKALSDNRWFATPEAEIQHASNWKGERP